MGEVRAWDLSASDKPAAQWTPPDFTSWGTIKTHHYCGGIYGLAFSPDNSALLCCGMGAMADPMAGNGKMTWQMELEKANALTRSKTASMPPVPRATELVIRHCLDRSWRILAKLWSGIDGGIRPGYAAA